MLKISAKEMALPLFTLFNSCIKKGTSPSDWSRGDWTPVFKKGDRQAQENYRPITVLSLVAHRGHAANKRSCCKLRDRKVCARTYGKSRTRCSCIWGPLTSQVTQSGGKDEGRRHVWIGTVRSSWRPVNQPWLPRGVSLRTASLEQLSERSRI